MARLNEPLVSTDTLETLRKKMLRQNRDLAKSNNARALRIRDLENECTCMLSENLELRGRILELEKQVEDGDARRIADHALAIKSKLESQLTDWTSLIAELGVEPPPKRRSPAQRRPTMRSRLSFSASRPSPSQRRLRDVAREIDELGHISENKAGPRRSMNPEQILALRSQADLADSPELGPPPLSKFIDEDPVKVDSPIKATVPMETQTPSPTRSIEPPILFAEPPTSPVPEPSSPSPIMSVQQLDIPPPPPEAINSMARKLVVLSVKTGAKRKLSVRDDGGDGPTQPAAAKENQVVKMAAEKPQGAEKAEIKKLPAGARKDERERRKSCKARQPLAAKSINEDLRSPNKKVDGLATTKQEPVKTKLSSHGRSKSKTKSNPSMAAPEVAVASPEPLASPLQPAPASPPRPEQLEPPRPVNEDAFLSPSSPEPGVSCSDHHGGDTPPPADISASGEATRPSRRNRAAISYAEPNLRDKMRRPSKQLFDAVTGEGKNRRSSQAETPKTRSGPEPPPSGGEPWAAVKEPPPSPLAGKQSPPQELPDSVATTRRRRPSSTSAGKSESVAGGARVGRSEDQGHAETNDADVYEFTSSSPLAEADGDEAAQEPDNVTTRRQTLSSSRRPSTVDRVSGTRDRGNGRRRSMMV
ncbi:hypothetical protein XA68_11458 [Ophiocordyceps unilateralis]|uniref:Shugoshin n=1 Tax=Ophiocordyceps unilateralis TaxID=268505 RepID=A0A2A9PGS8_OPHUN|nr:hypothetical protein XA68_11458 [Ophiocordyceps unilateralis]